MFCHSGRGLGGWSYVEYIRRGGGGRMMWCGFGLGDGMDGRIE